MAEFIAEHPLPEQLRAFAEGRLEATDFAAVEAHVSTCADCCRVLDAVPSDSFVRRLKAFQGAAATTLAYNNATLADPPPAPVELIDHPRYRVMNLVGCGGMGAVYRAEHRRMDRVVALKVINPALLRNPAAASRFQQEARAAAQLDHPNIVRAFDADQAGDLHFLVMEFVAGTGLADVVAQRGPLPVAEACGFARQAAQGLQHAHERGMIHRDIKPHNLMLTPDGAIKILDFGLARLVRAEDAPAGEEIPGTLTIAGAVMGTADYIAPEQANDSRQADIRSDIYALGCTLFHLLAGRPPFPDGTNAQKFEQHAKTSLPLPNEWPDGLKAVLRTMTAKDPVERYATPAEAAAALEPLTRFAPAKRKPRRRWVAAAALLLVVGAVAAGVVKLRVPTDNGEVVVTVEGDALELVTRKGGEIVRIRDLKTGDGWDVDTKNYRLATLDHPDGLCVELPERGTITLKRADGKVTVTTGPKGVQAPSTIENPKVVRVIDPADLAKLPNAADQLKASDIPEDARAYLGGGDPQSVPPEVVAVFGDTRWRCSRMTLALAYSPDGSRVAACDRDEIRILDARSGRPLRVFETPFRDIPGPDYVAYSSDGRWLSVYKNGELAVIEAETGRRAWTWKPEIRGSTVNNFAFAVNGPTIYLQVTRVSPRGFTLGWFLEGRDAATGKIQSSWRLADFNGFAVSRDGRYVVQAPEEKPVLLGRLVPGRPIDWKRLEAKGGRTTRAVFSPTDDRFALACELEGAQKLVLFDAGGTMLWATPADDVSRVSFSNDGTTLFAFSYQGPEPVLRLRVADGKKLPTASARVLRGAFPFALSPDGQTLLCRGVEGSKVIVFDAITGRERSPSGGHPHAVETLAFSPDGRFLASAAMKTTMLWDLARGCEAWHLENELGATRLTFSPDGAVLARLDYNGLTLHQTSDGKPIVQIPNKGVFRIAAFSPDGSLIATGGDAVYLWRTSDGKLVRILDAVTNCSALTFSPDGSRLYGADVLGLTAWKTGTGEPVARCVHNGADIAQLEWLADGKTLVVATVNGRVAHLDPTADGKIDAKFNFKAPIMVEAEAIDSALSPGGRLLASVTTTGLCLAAADREGRSRWFHLCPARSWYGRTGFAFRNGTVAFSTDGRYLAWGNSEGVITLLRLSKRGEAPELRTAGQTASDLAWQPNPFDAKAAKDVSADARTLVGGGDPSAALSELVAVLGDTRYRCPWGTTDRPNYSADGKWLTVASGTRILVFEAATGRLHRALDPGPGLSGVWNIHLGPDGRSVAFIGDHNKPAVWDVATGHPIWTPEQSKLRSYAMLSLSPDGKRVALYGQGEDKKPGLEVWDIAAKKRVNELTGLPAHDGSRDPDPGRDQLQFTADGKALLVKDKCSFSPVLLWELTGGKAPIELPACNGDVTVGGLDDGRIVVLAQNMTRPFSSPDIIELRDSAGALLKRLEHGGRWPSVALDGKSILAVGPAAGPTSGVVVRRWDVATGKESVPVILDSLSWSADPGAFTFAPDGRTVAFGQILDNFRGLTVVRIFDTATGKELFPRSDNLGRVTALAWSPDGRTIVSGDNVGRLVRWSATTGVPVKLRDRTRMRTIQLAFSADGRALLERTEDTLVPSNSHGLFRWDTARWEEREFAVRLGQHLIDAAISPDGEALATANPDQTFSLFESSGKEAFVALQGDVVNTVAFTPDGRFVVAGALERKLSFRPFRDGGANASFATSLTRVRHIARDPNGTDLRLFGSDTGPGAWACRALEVETRALSRVKLLDAGGAALSFADLTVSPDGRIFAGIDTLGRLTLRQVGEDACRRRDFPGYGQGCVVAFSPDGRFLAVGQRSGMISILRLAERGQLPVIAEAELAPMPHAAQQ